MAVDLEEWRRRLQESVGGFDLAIDGLLHAAHAILDEDRRHEAPRGILLRGPPGSGKTYLAERLAVILGDQGEEMYILQAETAITQGPSGAETFRDILKLITHRAQQKLCIGRSVEVVLLEGAEALERNEEVEMEVLDLRQVILDLLLWEMQVWHQKALPVLLLVPWNSIMTEPIRLYGPQAVEASITLPIPLDFQQRKKVLQVCSKHLNLGETDDILTWAARSTGGFLPCDLLALCHAAALVAVKATDDVENLQVLKEHFQKAHAGMTPTSIRGASAVKTQRKAHGEQLIDNLDAVVGQEDAVLMLRSAVVKPFQALQLQNTPPLNFQLPPLGILLSGPPGSGKTFIAAQLSRELGHHFFPAAPADLLAARVGEAEKRVAGLFSAARRCAPSTVLLEDLDTLLPTESGANSEGSETCVAYTLRSELDLLQQRRQASATEAMVLIVATSSAVDQVAPWLLVPHRFSMHLQLKAKLNEEEMFLVLQSYAHGLAKDAVLKVASDALCKVDGTASDAAAICRLAAVSAVRRMVKSASSQELMTEDLLSAITTLSRQKKPSRNTEATI